MNRTSVLSIFFILISGFSLATGCGGGQGGGVNPPSAITPSSTEFGFNLTYSGKNPFDANHPITLKSSSSFKKFNSVPVAAIEGNSDKGDNS